VAAQKNKVILLMQKMVIMIAWEEIVEMHLTWNLKYSRPFLKWAISMLNNRECVHNELLMKFLLHTLLRLFNFSFLYLSFSGGSCFYS